MLKIFTGKGTPPSGFDATTISLSLEPSSKLQWENEKKMASESGYGIVWDLEMGPFLQDDLYIQSQLLAVEHFTDHLYPLFAEQTKGVIVHKGKIEEISSDFLLQVLAVLPDSVTPFLLFEKVEQEDLLSLLHLAHFRIGVKEGILREHPSALQAFGWDHGDSPYGYFATEIFPTRNVPEIKIGVLDVSTDFTTLPSPFKLILEEDLTKEWDGLDYLVLPKNLSPQGRRKVAGFEAAGGKVLL